MQRTSAYILVVLVFALMTVGLVGLYSTSYFAAPNAEKNPENYLLKQAMWMGVGTFFCILAMYIRYEFWKKILIPITVVTVILLICCYFPALFGHKVKGAARWVKYGGFQFQPSELAKLALVIGTAWWFSRPTTDARTLKHGFLIPLGCAAPILALILFEKDLGATALIFCAVFVVMFMAGVRWLHLIAIGATTVALLIAFVATSPVRMKRVDSFLHPELNPAEFYQQDQGLIGLGAGGVYGRGIGEGRQRFNFLPEAHTDFLLPTIGEEHGLKATLGITFGLVAFTLCGVLISSHARDRFGMLLGFGIVTLIAVQGMVNIAVVTGSVPNKGFPLPFVSYGGSNLVFCLLCVGILLNLYRTGETVEEHQKKQWKFNIRLRRPRKPVRL